MLGEHFEIISRMTRRDEPPFTFEGPHARVENVVNAPRTGGGDHVRLLIGGHGKNVTFRLAAKYCDEINIDAAGRRDGRGDRRGPGRPLRRDRARSRRRSDIATGTNPAWPYPGLRATGRQRMMTQEDLPAIMPTTSAPSCRAPRRSVGGSSWGWIASSAACPGWSTPTRGSTS